MTTETETLTPDQAKMRWPNAMFITANKEAIKEAERQGCRVRVEYIHTPLGPCALSMECDYPSGHTEPEETCEVCNHG